MVRQAGVEGNSERILAKRDSGFHSGIAGGAVLILARGPTVTAYRLLGFLECMFVLTGTVLVAVIRRALSKP